MYKPGTINQEKATICDVAEMAGVSIKTVSRVANREPNVREQTRTRVQNAIDALGYCANPYAKYLGSLRRQGVDQTTAAPPLSARPDTDGESHGTESA